MTVQAKLIPYGEHFKGRTDPQPTKPGEYRFESSDYHSAPAPEPGKEGRLSFACPRGTGNCGSVRIGNGFKPEGAKSWFWNGDVQKPTLTPSINCLSGKTGNPKFPDEEYAGCGWHAYLTNGEFTGE